ncbi:MAG: transposase [Actinomycetota bacterium]
MGCPQAEACLVRDNAQRRRLQIGAYEEELTAARERFNDPEHRERYRRRGPEVETVFGLLRAILGFTRWVLRGAARVSAEARFFTVAYQLRKIQAARRTQAQQLAPTW